MALTVTQAKVAPQPFVRVPAPGGSEYEEIEYTQDPSSGRWFKGGLAEGGLKQSSLGYAGRG